MKHSEIRILTDDELSAIAGGARLDDDLPMPDSAGTPLAHAALLDAVPAWPTIDRRVPTSR